MKTLGAPYLKFFTCKPREKERVVWCSREIALSRQESCFLGHQNRLRYGLSLAVSFHHKYIHCVSSASSAQTNVESEEIQNIYSDQLRPVHVRFKLQKECAFGQQFVMVGDDPIFGLWNPSDGVPLNWSDGHVWTAEVDIPSGKLIKYKFVLKGNTGTIIWQPGPDRILETWDTEKTIIVFEDWDNPELQNIIEEEVVVDLSEESLMNSDLLIVAENLNQPTLDEGTDVIKELVNAKGHTDHEKLSAPMVAENITEDLGQHVLSSGDEQCGLMSVTDQKNEERTIGNDEGALNGSNFLGSKDEIRLVSDEETLALVPGLTPMLPEGIEAADVDEMEKNSPDSTPTGSDEIVEITEPELQDENVASLHSTETSEMMIDDKEQPQPYGEEQLENDVLEGDMQWGRRTLQKFLANLGFQ